MDQFNPDNFEPAVILATYGIIFGVLFVVWLIASIITCVLVSKCYEAIPAQYRAMEPGKVWLLLIPCFSLVWNFFVFPGLSKSYKAYFDSVGDTTVGDCYAQVALWLSIVAAICILPCCTLYAAVPSTIVLLIIYLVKAYDLKAKIKIG